jgi:hypothetical protein
MSFRVAALIALLVAGAALGVASGFVAEAPAGSHPPPAPVKPYDPLS